MAKVIGLDVGTKRIGVAKADSDVRIAVPMGTLNVDGNEFDRIIKLSTLLNTNLFVIGLPRNSKGEETAQSTYSRNFAKKLKAKLPNAKVCFQDESLTSVVAEKRLQDRKKNYTKGDIDSEAAAIILQDFLEKLTKDLFETKEEVVEAPTPKKKSKKKSSFLKIAKKKAKKHPIISFSIASAAALLLLSLIFGAWYNVNLAPVYSEAECAKTDACQTSVIFAISEGMSSKEIAKKLEQEGIIKNSLAFRIYLIFHGLTGSIQSGDYKLLRSSKAEEVARLLTDGSANASVFRLTIIPGETVADVRDRLLGFGYKPEDIRSALDGTLMKGHPALKSKPADASLEGYLYGDTYEFYVGESLYNIMSVILNKMDSVIKENDLENRYAAQGLTLHEGIILASVVQKESPSGAEADIAKVFLNRINNGIMLGSDATVTYAVDQIDPNRNVYVSNAKKLSIESCYNTRKYAGLPCGAISNPGIEALKSVAAPADSSYLYFLTGDDGKMYYSTTEEQHLQNISSYCQVHCDMSL